MNFFNLIAVLSAIFILSNCTQNPAHMQNSPSRGQAYYGEFCGPGVPRVADGPIAAQIRETQSIKPRDDLDWACKQHDLCYMREDDKVVCDFLLNYLLDHWALPRGCANIGYDINSLFYRKNGRVDAAAWTKILTAPLGAARLAVDHGLINTVANSKGSEGVQNGVCNFSNANRKNYIATNERFGRRRTIEGYAFGPAVDWGQLLPNSVGLAKRIYFETPASGEADGGYLKAHSAYQIGILYLFGKYGGRNEAMAYSWFGKCKSFRKSCRLYRQAIEYRRKYVSISGGDIHR